MAKELNAITKPRLEYTVYSGRNPIEDKTLLLPRIINKGAYDIAQTVEFAMQNGYILGGQFHSNLGAVNGYLQACRSLIMAGNDVKADKWFKAHLELTGPVDQETKQLTDDNRVHLRFQPLADFKCDLSDFSWTLVSDTGVQPRVQHLQSMGGKNDKEIFRDADIIASGSNLIYDVSSGVDKIEAEWIDAAAMTHTITIVPKSSGYSMLTMAWPTAFNDVAIGTVVTFRFFLTNGHGSESAAIPAIKTATIVENDMTTITKVTQAGRADDTVLHNQTSPCVVHGTNLTLDTSDKVLIELYRDGVCIDEGDLSANGKVSSSSDTAINLSGFYWNNRTVPDGEWWDAYPDSKLIVVKNGIRYVHPITFKGE